MPKELAFKKIRWDGSTIHGDKGLSVSPTVLMKIAREDLFSRSTLALDEYGTIHSSDVPSLFEDLFA